VLGLGGGSGQSCPPSSPQDFIILDGNRLINGLGKPSRPAEAERFQREDFHCVVIGEQVYQRRSKRHNSREIHLSGPRWYQHPRDRNFDGLLILEQTTRRGAQRWQRWGDWKA